MAGIGGPNSNIGPRSTRSQSLGGGATIPGRTLRQAANTRPRASSASTPTSGLPTTINAPQTPLTGRTLELATRPSKNMSVPELQAVIEKVQNAIPQIQANLKEAQEAAQSREKEFKKEIRPRLQKQYKQRIQEASTPGEKAVLQKELDDALKKELDFIKEPEVDIKRAERQWSDQNDYARWAQEYIDQEGQGEPTPGRLSRLLQGFQAKSIKLEAKISKFFAYFQRSSGPKNAKMSPEERAEMHLGIRKGINFKDGKVRKLLNFITRKTDSPQRLALLERYATELQELTAQFASDAATLREGLIPAEGTIRSLLDDLRGGPSPNITSNPADPTLEDEEDDNSGDLIDNSIGARRRRGEIPPEDTQPRTATSPDLAPELPEPTPPNNTSTNSINELIASIELRAREIDALFHQLLTSPANDIEDLMTEIEDLPELTEDDS